MVGHIALLAFNFLSIRGPSQQILTDERMPVALSKVVFHHNHALNAAMCVLRAIRSEDRLSNLKVDKCGILGRSRRLYNSIVRPIRWRKW